MCDNCPPFDTFDQIAVNSKKLKDNEQHLTSREKLDKSIEEAAMDITKGTRIFAAIRKRSRLKLVVNR